jgi:hypothetical protein
VDRNPEYGWMVETTNMPRVLADDANGGATAILVDEYERNR